MAEPAIIAEESAEGKRFRLTTITVRTTWNDVNQITQTTEWPFQDVTKRVLNVQERHVREALIAQGWTPPEKK